MIYPASIHASTMSSTATIFTLKVIVIVFGPPYSVPQDSLL